MVIQERAEGQRPYVSLGDTPYKVVAAAFEDFQNPLSYGRERGGIVRPAKEPILRAQLIAQARGVKDNYHVQMSFTPEQRRFVMTAFAYYNALLEGRTFTPEQPSLPTFAERVDSYGKEGTDFPRAMLYSVLDSLYDFYELYPNLMPAMNAAFQIAGAEGMTEVINSANHDMKKHATVESPMEDGWEFNRNIFAHPHTVRSENGDRALAYEVMCTGESVAKTMLAQAGRASGSFIEALRSGKSRAVTLSFEEDESVMYRIERCVTGLAEESAANYSAENRE